MLNYMFGCKCVLILNDYYLVLLCKNVDVIIIGIDYIEVDVVVMIDGKCYEVDCLIYGIGFQVVDLYLCGVIIGCGGFDIVDVWCDGVYVYFGLMLFGYLNFFMIVGLNIGFGYNLMVFMIELQIEYIFGVLQVMCCECVDVIEVCLFVEVQFNSDLQGKLKKVIWLMGGCKSWYFDLCIGKNMMLWLGFMWCFCQVIVCFLIVDYYVYCVL